MSFFKDHKVAILSAIIGVSVTGGIPTIVWVHNAYADDRYVQKTEQIRAEIRNIDNSLFEINQEISFAPDPRVKAKYEARKEYYENLKEALILKLTNPDKK